MSGLASRGRPSKRSLIVIDPMANGQPAAKKAAEPEKTSKEVLDIVHKLTKLDKDKHAAIRTADEQRTRADHLEKLLAKKPAPADDRSKKLAEKLQKDVISLTKELKEERSKATENQGYRKKCSELTSQFDELARKHTESDESKARQEAKHKKKIEDLRNQRNKLAESEGKEKKLVSEQQKKIDELTHKLEEAGDNERKMKEEQQKKIDKLTRSNAEKEKKLAEDHTKIETLTGQLEYTNTMTSYKIGQQQEAIDKLERTLAALREPPQQRQLRMPKSEVVENAGVNLPPKNTPKPSQQQTPLLQQQQQQPAPVALQQMQVQPVPAKVPPPPPMRAVKSEMIDVSTSNSSLSHTGGAKISPNIFETHYTESEDSVVYEHAVAALNKMADTARDSFGDRKDEWKGSRNKVLSGEKLTCACCNKTCERSAILGHFVSKDHGQKVKGNVPPHITTYVSRAAVDYWFRKIESAAKKRSAVDTSSADNGTSSDDSDDDEEEEGRLIIKEEPFYD